MAILEKLGQHYDKLFRRYFALTQDNWSLYTRFIPFSGVLLKYTGHPVLGPYMRRLYRFEGPGRQTQSHIIPISEDLTYKNDNKLITPIDLLRNVIEDSSYRIIMNRCVCRDGYGCTEHPRDLGCIMLGEACRNMVARGIARQATVEECLEHLDKAKERELVAIAAWAEFETVVKGIPHEHHQDYFEICLCCTCCCLGMRHYKDILKSEHMRKIFKSIGWRARGTGDCTSCGMCVDACPVDAIEVGQNKISVADNCIGCGLCGHRCPEDAIVMEELEPMKENILDYFWGFQPKIQGQSPLTPSQFTSVESSQPQENQGILGLPLRILSSGTSFAFDMVKRFTE